jgi:hypothetical protein
MAVTVTALAAPGTKPLPSRRPKVGLRGATAAVFLGPLAGVDGAAIAGPASPTHATGVAGGGVEDSTGSRKSDTYSADAGTGGNLGTVATPTADTRPTGRTRYYGDGVQGGSLPGRPIASGTDHVYSGGGYATGSFDKRTSIDGEGGRALGTSGRGSSVAGETVTVKANKVGSAPTALDRPAQGGAASAGTVGIIDGTAGVMQVDVATADLTGGTGGKAGCLVAVFARGGDTDTDAKNPLFIGTVDGTTGASTLFTPGAGTYAVYVAWRYPRKDGGFAYGPFSARTPKTIT